MNALYLRRTATGALVTTAVVHLGIAVQHLREVPYIGLLFILGAVLCLGAAVPLWRGDSRTAWTIGALTCFGMLASYLLSRTVGLLGGYLEKWTERPFAATLAAVAEVVIVWLALTRSEQQKSLSVSR